MGLGVGVGLLAAAVLASLLPQTRALSNAEIAERARGLGMAYLTELPGRTNSAKSLTILVGAETTPAQVAEMLRAGGALTDTADFLSRAVAAGLETKLVPGAHTVMIGESADQHLLRLLSPAKP